MSNILQHYPKEHHNQIKDLINNFSNVVQNDRIIKLGFVDCFTLETIKTLEKEFSNVDVLYIEKTLNFERVFVQLKPRHIFVKDPNICYAEVMYNKKFNSIAHSNVLGTILNNNVDYSKIGDILITEDEHIHLVCEHDVVSELSLNCSIINNAKVTYRIHNEEIVNLKKAKEYTINCSSLRIDSLVKAFINKNRDTAQNLIKQKLVKKNQVIINSNTKSCQMYDIISIRGYGRFEIINIVETKSSRFRVSIKV